MRRKTPKLVEKATEDVVKVLDNDNDCLKFSGYNFTERHQIIEAGITNYKKDNRLPRCKVKECLLHKKKQEPGEARRG